MHLWHSTLDPSLSSRGLLTGPLSGANLSTVSFAKVAASLAAFCVVSGTFPAVFLPDTSAICSVLNGKRLILNAAYSLESSLHSIVDTVKGTYCNNKFAFGILARMGSCSSGFDYDCKIALMGFSQENAFDETNIEYR